MRDSASALLTLLYVCGVIVAIFYIALVVSLMVVLVRDAIAGRLAARRDAIRSQEIDQEAKSFRAELDTVDLGAELRQRGRAA